MCALFRTLKFDEFLKYLKGKYKKEIFSSKYAIVVIKYICHCWRVVELAILPNLHIFIHIKI